MRKFKLFFACLLMAVLSIGQVWAETYSLVSNAGDLSAGDEIIIVNTAADYAISTNQATKNRTATAVSVSEGKITPGDAVQIITLGEATKNSTTYWTLQPEAGKYLYAAASDKNQMKTKTTLDDNGKWSISISSDGTATITAQGANRPLMRYNPNNNSPIFACYATTSTTGTLVKIYKKDAPPATTVVAPVFTPNGGNFVGTTSVTITSETENATIYYTMGEDPADPTESSTPYTGAIPVSATTTIKAIAAKSGMTTSAVITKTFTKLETKTIAQVLDGLTTSETAEFALNDVTVTYANGKNIYVKDASGYMLVYDNNNAISGAENGKVLNGLWGKAKKYYGLPEISSITKVPSVNEGSAVEAEALNAYPTAEDLNKYAILEGVTFASAHTLATSGNIENVEDASYKGSTFTLRNNFKIAATLASGKSYRVLGIVQIYNTTYQVYPITISEILVPAMTVNPTALDFGTIGVGDAAPAELTFAVSGSNLSANLSASVTEGADYYDIAVTYGSLDKDANNEVAATITVTPKAAINESAGTKAGTITIAGSGLNETVSLTTEVKAKHAINFNTGGVSAIPSVNVREGAIYDITEAPTFDPAKSCEFGTFVGWTMADEIANASVKPALVSKVTMETSDVTLHAVYSKTVGGGTTEETASVTIGTYATDNNWESGTKYTTIAADENITLTAAGGGNTGKYYTTGNEWRFYQTESATLTISAADGCTLKNATLTFGVSNTGELSGTNGAVTSGEAYTISGDEYEFSVGNSGEATNGQVKFTVISVTYDKSSGTTTYSLEANCCAPNNISLVNNGVVTGEGTFSADVVSACENATVTITAVPNSTHTFSKIVVYETADETNIMSDDDIVISGNEAAFEMPNYAVTVNAVFASIPCTQLETPAVSVSGKDYPYDAVKLNWAAIDDAEGYEVYIYNNDDSDVESDLVDGNQYTIATTLEPGTTYKYKVVAVSTDPLKCASEDATGTFMTDALPEVQLYYVKKQGADPIDGGTHTLGEEFDLTPSDLSCTKTFVGWTTEAYKDHEAATAPAVLMNKYTFTSNTPVTLYAVYADVTGGGESSVEFNAGNYATANGWEDATAYTSFTINGVTFTANGGANDGKYYNSDKTWRLYNGGSLSISASGVTISSVSSTPSVSFTENNGIYSCSFTATTKFKSITVNVSTPVTYANYATTCVAAPVATPDLAEVNNVSAAGANGTITMAYENVDEDNIEVGVYTDAEGTVAAGEGFWLTASLNSKNISYSVAANTTSYVARTAYIKLTAPAEVSGPADAEVIIPVTQEKYIPAFANLAALVEANIPTGTDVTVTFANEVITGDQYISQGTKRAGILLTTTAGDNAIEIFYNKGTTVVPAEWVTGGSLSATEKTFTWTLYNSQWELVPLGTEWTWDNGDLQYSAPAASLITVSPSGDVLFAAVDRGTSVADKELTVTLTNVASATAELTGATSVFSIDNETPANGDKINISVNSDVNPDTYAAVLTISDDADEAEDVVINISITISAAETAVSTTSKWVAATEIVDGMQVLIVTTDGTDVFAMGANRGNNRGVVEASVDEDVLTPGEGTMAFTLVAQDGGTFALRASNGKYLYAGGTGTSNWLNTKAYSDELDANAKWNIDLGASTIIATSSNRNDMRFNKGNNPKIISCYQSTSSTTTYPRVALYVPKQDTPEPEDWTEGVRTGLHEGWYYTMCLEKAVTDVRGASIWSVVSKTDNGEHPGIILEEAELPLVAGRPYIFNATAASLDVIYTGAAVGDPVTEGNNGLVGSFSQAPIAQSPDNFIIYHNELYYVNSENVTVGAHRAYLDMTEVPAYNNNEPQQGAPRRRVVMTVHSEQTTTDIDALNASEAPVKMIIDGQLFILRGEQMFNANGQLVK